MKKIASNVTNSEVVEDLVPLEIYEIEPVIETGVEPQLYNKWQSKFWNREW